MRSGSFCDDDDGHDHVDGDDDGHSDGDSSHCDEDCDDKDDGDDDEDLMMLLMMVVVVTETLANISNRALNELSLQKLHLLIEFVLTLCCFILNSSQPA